METDKEMTDGNNTESADESEEENENQGHVSKHPDSANRDQDEEPQSMEVDSGDSLSDDER